MFSWFYIYLVVIMVILGILFWIYNRINEWWYPDKAKSLKINDLHVQEILMLENSNHHLLRLYTIETFAQLESAETTLSLFSENCKMLLSLWEKILGKEHYLNFAPLQKQKWSLYLSLIEMMESQDEGEGDVKEIQSECKKLRSNNRRIAQLHEDWWGLKYDGSNVMKAMNEMDKAFVSQINHISQEDYPASKTDFQTIFYYQEEIEMQMKQ